MKRQMALARVVHLVLLAVLRFMATRDSVYVGLKYALVMSALWWLIEMAIRLNPSMLNIPGLSDHEHEQLMFLEPKDVGPVIAPICIGAACAAVLFGMAVTSLVASSATTGSDIAILFVPATPLMLGIPLYLVIGRLNELQTERCKRRADV